MGVTTEMSFVFKREKHARWAAHMVEGIIKVALAEETELDENLGLSRHERKGRSISPRSGLTS